MFIVTWPDGLAAHKLVTTGLATEVDKSIVVQGVCVGHGLQTSANCGMQSDGILNGQLSLASTLYLASNSSQVSEGMMAVARRLEIVRSIHPPPQRLT